LLAAPSISLPQGGGAIRGIGEKFAANPVSGTGRLTVPLATTPGRSGFGPKLALSYDSGAGNGPFGFGWHLSVLSVTRKTEQGLPRYRDADAEESDVYLLPGDDDLVPMLDPAGQRIVDETSVAAYAIHRYRPRIEGGFARIERWVRKVDGDVHWRLLSPDNVLSVYGKDDESRIADPADSRRIFSWLLCEARDDRGNAIVYEYKREDAAGVDVTLPHEVGRGTASSPTRRANHYLKRIRYGNRVPLVDNAGRRLTDVAPQALQDAGWLFEVVFDYGEHDLIDPKSGDNASWLCRNDPFSTYRAGFEVRTYRLCQRVLMFHHFPAEPEVRHDCLVGSTDFAYRELRGVPEDRRRGHPLASFVASVTPTGYTRADAGGYTRKSLPPLAFEYSQATIASRVETLDPVSLENIPAGLDDGAYHWVDLNGEGLSGVLTEQADAWFYKPNLGEARFGPLQRLASRPSLSKLGGGRQRLLDLAGDGQVELAQFDAQPAGFFERTTDDGWENFVPFAELPNVDWSSPNLQLIDLTGDGHADLLLTDDDVVTWYPSLAEEGFGPARRVPQALDEERGPRLVLADGTQTIFLADMSGDGLTDLVRIRSAELCYWPNIGYGRFGAKVTMSNAPRFDERDRFDPRRIRLADIDGSGVVDVLYVGEREVRLWLNESGNGWGVPQHLLDLPHLDGATDVRVADLLGNGTACLVWSSRLPADARRPVRYIDLMGGTKPHLLVKVVNNLGAETRIGYAASTKFYLADREAGRQWITRLPFPVHVVEHVEHLDRVSRTRFASRYAYHHGYFDGADREFRGFGMVEQQDTDAFEDYVVGVKHVEGTQELAPELYQPPVTTRTWFHTGAHLGGDRILHQLRDEYYLGQQHVADPALPPGLDEDELRECVRSLKGLPIRQEVYSFDGSPKANDPYRVVEHSYEVRRLQPRGEERHAVCFSYGCETLTHHYERNPADPSISHSFNLEVGPNGNVLRSASVVYGRKVADPALPAEVRRDQQSLHVTCSETVYTPDIDRSSPVPAYRLRTAYDARDYEITGVVPAAGLFTLTELKGKIAGAVEIPYEASATGATAQKRLLTHSRTLFRDNGLARMPLGQWDSLGLGYESYVLAFTPGVVSAYYAGELADADFTKAGYVHFGGDANWWTPSGTAVYPANPAAHFFRPSGTRDALGVETMATFDQYDILPERVRLTGAAWSEVSATNDYRVLGPVELTDPNKNRRAVEIDELGLVVRSAVRGKAGVGEGDSLADPTVRVEYDLFNWMSNGKPTFARVLAREQHGAANPRWHESYLYSNGRGGLAMVKAQAHPGKALRANPDGTVSEVDADPRWIGNGRTILDNKGNPVKQYEPFFSTTHEYEDEEALRTIGATPILHYDAVGRNIRTDFPDGTLARVVFDPWTQRVFDPNDTILESRWYTERGSPDPVNQPEPLADPERRAAWLAAKHAGTPSVAHLDSIGRTVSGVFDYGNGKTGAVRSEVDLTGRTTRMFDQLQRRAGGGFTGMAGTPVYAESAEQGARWTFLDVLGGAVRSWDEHGRTFRVEYDALHRQTAAFVQQAGQPEILFNYTVYGDRHPNAVQLNLVGIAHQVFDTAGMLRVRAIDFKGNPTSVERVLARDYKSAPDWAALAAQPDYASIEAAAAPALVTSEPFLAGAAYDALNRPVQVTLHGGTVLSPVYNEANFLASLRVQIEGRGPFVECLAEQDYDAKGQRRLARYGNGLITRYSYDPRTFRLTNLVTLKSGAPASGSLQDLHYTYDPVGNITQCRDDAQQTHFFANAVVKPECLYEYDALYQLVKATGREHAGLSSNTGEVVARLPHVNDASAVRNYSERYEYDRLGNLKEMRHAAAGGMGSWHRRYRYAYEDDPANRTNRLASTSRPGDPDAGPYSVTYDYDQYGNMTRLHTPTPGELDWDFMDQLQRADLEGGGTAHYAYSLAGQRVRKVIERQGAPRTERIYLGPLEIYRERQGNDAPHLERRTLHIGDDVGRIAQVDVKTRDETNADPTNPLNTPLIRYQYGNQLGSAAVETDAAGAAVSYEEYHPFGTSAYRSGKPGVNLSLKRYRFAGKERDDETGLCYFGARYYAPWLGRWTSTDPAGFVDGFNLYRYCRNSPVVLSDPDGRDPTDPRCDHYLAGSDIWFRMTPNPRGEGSIMVGCDPNPAPPPPVITDEVVVRGPPRKPSSKAAAATAPARSSDPPLASDIPPPEPLPPPEPSPSPPSAPSTAGGGSSGSGGQPDDRTFWSRGGGTLVTGGILLGAGLLTIFTAGAATPLLVLAAGALATAGGVTVTSVSAINLTASYSGSTTAQQDRETSGTLHTVGSLSSPLGLTSGTAGMMIADDPRRGLETGALVGNVAELGVGVGRFGMARWSTGTARELSNDAGLIKDMAQLEPTVPRGVTVIGSHGSPGMYQTFGGSMAPISDLAPMVQGGSQGRVMLLMCNVGHDPAAVQALSNSTGRSITAYTNGVGSSNYYRVWAFTGRTATHIAPATVFSPQYLSPFLSLTPNVAAPGAATLSGATR